MPLTQKEIQEQKNQEHNFLKEITELMGRFLTEDTSYCLMIFPTVRDSSQMNVFSNLTSDLLKPRIEDAVTIMSDQRNIADEIAFKLGDQ